MTDLFYNSDTNTILQIHGAEMTSMQMIYPYLSFNSPNATSVSLYNLVVTSGIGFAYNTSFNVSAYDPTSTGIEDLTTSWSLPKTFRSSYPDSTRINLGGYKTGPAIMYEAEWENGTIDFNTLNEIKVNYNLKGYNESA